MIRIVFLSTKSAEHVVVFILLHGGFSPANHLTFWFIFNTFNISRLSSHQWCFKVRGCWGGPCLWQEAINRVLLGRLVHLLQINWRRVLWWSGVNPRGYSPITVLSKERVYGLDTSLPTQKHTKRQPVLKPEHLKDHSLWVYIQNVKLKGYHKWQSVFIFVLNINKTVHAPP